MKLKIGMKSVPLFFCLMVATLASSCSHGVKYEKLSKAEAERIYTLGESCYIIRFEGSRDTPPQLAGVLPIPQPLSHLPEHVSEEFVGKKIGNIIILGVAPQGMKFAIAAMKVDRSFEIGVMESPIIRPMGSIASKWPLLDTLWIVDPSNRRKIHSAYASYLL